MYICICMYLDGGVVAEAVYDQPQERSDHLIRELGFTYIHMYTYIYIHIYNTYTYVFSLPTKGPKGPTGRRALRGELSWD